MNIRGLRLLSTVFGEIPDIFMQAPRKAKEIPYPRKDEDTKIETTNAMTHIILVLGSSL